MKGKPGIYYRPRPDGKVAPPYEVTFRDSTGKQRWQRVDGNLNDAVAVRADLLARMHRGEQIQPSKVTLAEYAPEWLAAQTKLRPRTRESYAWAIGYLVDEFGRLRLADITPDHVARLVARLEREGKSGWTISGVIRPLSTMLGRAERRGLIPANPVRKLERNERPHVSRDEMRVLSSDEISRLLDNSGSYRALLATALFTGLRFSEQLALRWEDIRFDDGYIRVRYQLERGKDAALVEPKTEQAKRQVPLMPALAQLLREHRMRSMWKQPREFVFASATGKPLQRKVARAALNRALKAAKVEGRFRWHDTRHTYASALIHAGEPVTAVQHALGHSSPAVTLNRYSHEFDAVESAERQRTRLEAQFGAVVSGNTGETREGFRGLRAVADESTNG